MNKEKDSVTQNLLDRILRLERVVYELEYQAILNRSSEELKEAQLKWGPQ